MGYLIFGQPILNVPDILQPDSQVVLGAITELVLGGITEVVLKVQQDKCLIGWEYLP